MKMKTKLMITFSISIILPMLLMCLSFVGIRYCVNRLLPGQMSFSEESDQKLLKESILTSNEASNDLFERLSIIASSKPDTFANMEYLDQLNEQASNVSSFLIVRRNTDLYFSGSESGTYIFSKLPAFGYGMAIDENRFYYTEMQILVKQIDFNFSDGSQGSIFIISPISALSVRTFFIYVIVVIAVVLILTACMLTKWVSSSILKPIRALGVAMNQISQGNLDYTLSTQEKGDFGDLYRNYEDMRLRLKESTDEKLQSEQQNKELISNISHDLKTPITSIKGYVEGIIDGVADTPEKMNRYVKTIYNKANDMDRLINELTFYSGIDSNQIPYNFHRINVGDYFRDCIEEVGLELEAKNIRLNYSNVVDPQTMIIADPEQLKRIINNIIGNSIKYMDKEEGEIDIRILDELDSICVEIEDNGKGIAARDLGNIFERFFRTDASRNSSKGGSGIGLSIVKKIIEDHGGYIWATSKENEGTCIHFVIRKYKEVNYNEQNIDH